MGAARDIRIIGDEDVALGEIHLVVFDQQLLHHAQHGGKMDRQRVFRLHDQSALGIGEGN